jgi:hypothetical protein
MKSFRRLLRYVLPFATVFSVCSVDSAAQQGTMAPPSATADPPGTPASGDPVVPSAVPAPISQPTPQSSQQTPTTSRDRIFFTLPNFLTVENASRVPPLTTEEKFGLTTRTAFDWVELLWYGAEAGVGQARNTYAPYGQGGAGYAKRYGVYFANGTLEEFATNAVLPSLLHQDPRYFQLGKGGFWRRTGYAVSRIFVTYSDSRIQQFNYSEIFGAAGAAAISVCYYPRGDRTLQNALILWGSQVGYDMFGEVLKEFWPDIRRKLHKSRGAQP